MQEPQTQGITVTREQIGSYLSSLGERGRNPSTVSSYRKKLELLYAALPGGRIGRGTLRQWREQLLDQRYDYGYAGFPTKSAADLYRLMRLARRNLYAVTCPVLVVQSRKDETITADSAEVIVNGVSSQRRGVMYLEDVPHVCTISREHAHIAQALEELFRKAETEKTA